MSINKTLIKYFSLIKFQRVKGPNNMFDGIVHSLNNIFVYISLCGITGFPGNKTTYK